MVAPYFVFLVLMVCERLFELGLSRRNASWALERGAIEYGRDHFRAMKLLHTSFFVACVAEVLLLERPFVPLLGWPMFALALAAQGLRYWAILSLGRRWNVRVLVIPEMAAVTEGPYRYVRHPNYLAVLVEGVAVPLIHGAFLTAVAFTTLNAWMLRVRIRCEEQALERHARYRERLGDRPRLVPKPAAVR